MVYDEQPGDSNSGRKVVGRMSTQYIGAKKVVGALEVAEKEKCGYDGNQTAGE